MSDGLDLEELESPETYAIAGALLGAAIDPMPFALVGAWVGWKVGKDRE